MRFIVRWLQKLTWTKQTENCKKLMNTKAMKRNALLLLIFAGTLFSCSDYSSMTKEELEAEKGDLLAKVDSVQHYIDLKDTVEEK